MTEEKDIELFSHNETAYQALTNGLIDYPLAFLEHATGTGKSFILLKYLYKHQRQKRILFISMHEEMFGQLFDEQMTTLGISKNDFYKFDTMIYANLLKQNPQKLVEEYDCIVFDEAHHCGAEKWSEVILELKELILQHKDKVMIGATATSIRYLDNFMDVSEVFFNGHTVSRLPVSYAILNNLLPAALYVNPASACQEYLYKVKKKLSNLPVNEEIKNIQVLLDNLNQKIDKENSVNNTLKKYGVKPGEKYIVFCKNIADLNRKKNEAISWFKDIGPIQTFAAHSGQKKHKNKEEIKEFSKKRPEISLMFAVDIFNEGFHIKGVDGVFMFRKTKSPIIYFQQIGRALSFSVRKKQIKIFDFVNNIAENDVIYELYKEIIAEAKRLIEEHPENKELYEEILDRFQIIDNTSTILDELKQIEKFINENYVIKNNLELAIMKLVEYRFYYPETDFNKNMENKCIADDYINAYNYICSMHSYLTIQDIEKIKGLNIDFGYQINMPLANRLEKLKGYSTFYELEQANLISFTSSYIAFVNKFNRRPTLCIDSYENDLYNKYRNYLNILKTSKLKKIIADFPFVLTVEELILTNRYPSKEEIKQYLNYINNKIENKKNLDEVEIKVAKRITRIVGFNRDTIFINQLDESVYKIEFAIATIAKYKKEVNSNEKFTNLHIFSKEENIYKAIKIIYKYATRVTNSQFEKLLSLDIELPKIISMSMEERLKLLGKYNSFYEKDQKDNIIFANQYIKFIINNKRRPNPNIENEKELCFSYNQFLYHTSISKLKEIANTLNNFNIPLIFEEKLLLGIKIPEQELNDYINIIVQKFSRDFTISSEDLKILRAIERYQDTNKKHQLKEFINKVKNIQEIDKNIQILEEYKVTVSKIDFLSAPIDIRRKWYAIKEKYKFLTKNQVQKLIKIGIDLPEELLKEIYSLENNSCIYEKELLKRDTLIEKLVSYYKMYSKRPEPDSELDILYKNYISNSTRNSIVYFIETLKKDIPLTIDEEIILGIYPKELSRNYFDSLIKKEYLSTYEHKILTLADKGSYKKDKKKIKDSNSQNFKSFNLEEQIVSNLKYQITLNPQEKVNYDNEYFKISEINRQKLEKYRQNILIEDFLNKILIILRKNKKPLQSCLDKEQYQEFEKILQSEILDNKNLELIKKVTELNYEYIYLEQNLIKEQFLKEYIDFIIAHNGLKPSISAQNDQELSLATHYEAIKDTLTNQDLLKISKVVKQVQIQVEEDNFYEKFIDFINNNGRFPCGNSDNNEEVYLNNAYLNFYKKLSKEEKNNLQKLQKIYGRATLLANIEFRKKKEGLKK